ncbi:MAG: methyltransferase domain-containing protein [Pseudomonadota bacterium]
MMREFIADRSPPDLYETYLAQGLFMPWADVLLDRLDARGTCLDIACGTGVVSRKLSGRADVESIKAIDVAPPMIAKATALQQAQDLAGKAEFIEASALALPFDDDSFDMAFCQQGLQFFPDKILALSEARRVLKPGGRLGAAIWTSAQDGNPVFGAFEKALEHHVGSDVLPMGPFSFGDGEAVLAVAEQAGLDVGSVEKQELLITLPPVRELVLFDLLFLGRPGPDGSLQPVIDPDDQSADALIEAIISDLAKAVSAFVTSDGSLRAPTTAHLLIARKS